MTLNSSGNLLIGTNIDAGYTITARTSDASIAAMSSDASSQLRLNAQSGIAILETVTNTPLRIRTNSTEAMRVFTNGNVFIGASPVDGGQKLQVSGTAYASSDIITGGALRVVGSATYYACIASGTALYYGFDNASLILRTNSATALTLDAAQAATFAQGVRLYGLASNFTTASSNIALQVGLNPQIQIIHSSGATDEKVYDWLATSTQLQGRLVNDTNGAANNWITVSRSGYTVSSVAFGGPIKLNNAYQAGAPTATGYVTIQDSAGNTYKVLVGT